MIELKDLTVLNDKTPVVSAVSTKLPNGKTYGVVSAEIGDSARFLASMAGVAPYGGVIRINGYDLRSQHRKACAILGYLPLNAPLDESMNAEEILFFAADVRGIPYERAARRAHELLEATGLDDISCRQVSSLDEIDRRLLAVAQAAMGSEILLLSNPANGLSESETEELFALIEHLGESRTIFLSADSPEELPRCDEMLLIKDGALIEHPSDELLASLSKKPSSPRKGRTKSPSRKPQRDGEYEVIDEED